MILLHTTFQLVALFPLMVILVLIGRAFSQRNRTISTYLAMVGVVYLLCEIALHFLDIGSNSVTFASFVNWYGPRLIFVFTLAFAYMLRGARSFKNPK